MSSGVGSIAREAEPTGRRTKKPVPPPAGRACAVVINSCSLLPSGRMARPGLLLLMKEHFLDPS